MRLMHLSDLHIGKRVNEYSMLEDQQYILSQILNIAYSQKPFGVIIAGDVYDKSVPSAEAVQLFDDFLVKLAERNLKVFVISGNHDSPERLAFAGRIMNKSGIYISPVYDGNVKPISFDDEYGKINFYLLPFVKPSSVRRFYPENEIETYTDAVKTAIDAMKINTSERNVIIAHQFVTGAGTSGSEELSVGGSENVSADVFADFDYCALGHIHRPQNVCGSSVRYCGTPLKYSFSEVNHQKSVTVAEIGQKGNICIKTTKLVPLHDMCEIKGEYETLVSKSFYSDIKTDSYMSVILTDENEIPEALGRLRAIYPNIMRLGYDNARTKNPGDFLADGTAENKTPFEFFAELYKKQNGIELDEYKSKYIKSIIENISEVKK